MEWKPIPVNAQARSYECINDPRYQVRGEWVMGRDRIGHIQYRGYFGHCVVGEVMPSSHREAVIADLEAYIRDGGGSVMKDLPDTEAMPDESMARTPPNRPDAAHLPDLPGASPAASQPDRHAGALRKVVTVKCHDNGFRRGLVLAILILSLGALQHIAQADAQYVVTVSDWCNIREAPRKDSADAGNLYAGDAVTGIGYQNGWVQVDVATESGTGWVRADLLSLADCPTGRYANSSGGRVNIRKTPGGDHAAWLKAGHSVAVIRWVDVGGAAWAVTQKGFIDGQWITASDANEIGPALAREPDEPNP